MIMSDIVNGMATNESSNASLSSVKKNNEAKDASTLDVNDFLQLLVTQMQYQDPLQPTDNTQYIAQMATFTQVEATAQMNNSVEQQMASEL
ncbi:MAG: flagellar hook capping protein, partial [Lachnospira sp.]|nr:flagellar hook capping protein [Lachnospira sp.]